MPRSRHPSCGNARSSLASSFSDGSDGGCLGGGGGSGGDGGGGGGGDGGGGWMRPPLLPVLTGAACFALAFVLIVLVAATFGAGDAGAAVRCRFALGGALDLVTGAGGSWNAFSSSSTTSMGSFLLAPPPLSLRARGAVGASGISSNGSGSSGDGSRDGDCGDGGDSTGGFGFGFGFGFCFGFGFGFGFG